MALKDYITLDFLARNKVSETTEEITASLQDLQREKKETDAELKKVTAQIKLIEKFKTLEATLQASEKAAISTANKVERLSTEMGAAGVPTQKMANELKAAQLSAKAADRAFISNTNNLARMSAQTTAAVGDIANLDAAEARLTAEANSAAAASANLASNIKKVSVATAEAADKTEKANGAWSDLWAKTTLITGAIAGLVIGFKAFLTSSSNAEYANKKLADTLTRTTNATESQIRATLKQAEALQLTTRFNDEEIKASQEKLAQYQLTAEQVQRLTPLLLDMAESKRESGDADADTIGSAEAIGDAVRDNITALESYGVHITDATEEQYKAAGETERMAIIVDRLTKSFGGAAVAAGQTFTGAMDRSANKVKQSLEDWAAVITQNETIKGLLVDVGELFDSMGPKATDGAGLATIAISGLGVLLGLVVDSLVLSANILQNIWHGVTVSILSVEKVAVNAWASIQAALGNDEAAAGARRLAETIDGQLAESFKSIEQNTDEMGGAIDKMGTRFTQFGAQIDKTTEALDGASKGTDKLTTAIKKNGAATEQTASQLKDYLAELGLSYDKLATGVDSSTEKTIKNFSNIILEVAKTTTKADELAAVLGPALKATLESIDTPEGFIALEKMIDKTAKTTDGLAGKILGVLSPALVKHERQLESTGVYVDYVKERYDNLAKILGVELPAATDAAGAALDENSSKLEKNAAAAKASGDSTIKSVEQTAEVVSAKGAGLATFFNAAASQLYGLSEAAGQAFNENLGQGVADGVEYYTAQSAKSLDSLQRSMESVTTNGMARWLKSVASNSYKIQSEYYAQRAEVEKLTQALEATENPSKALVRSAAAAAEQFDLLDDATLSSLKGQIDAARSAIQALEQDAASTLAAIENDLANARGEFTVSVKNEYDARLQELEQKLTDAGGNAAAKNDLNEAISKLKELREIDLQEARARETEARQKNNTAAATRPENQTPTVINFGGQSVKVTAAPDELKRLEQLASQLPG